MHDRHFLRRPGAWLALAALAGCLPNLDLDSDVELACNSNADCPGTWQCVAERCVAPDRLQEAIDAANRDLLVTPTLRLPAGQTAVKNGDLLVVGGATEAGATLISAALVATIDGAVLQATTAEEVALQDDGTLVGSLLARALPDGVSVALAVVVEGRGKTSPPGLSAGVLVDNQPPTAVSITAAVGPATAVPETEFLLEAAGANFVFIDGDLEDGPDVRALIPFAPRLTLVLSAGDGPKAVTARYFDTAANVAQAATVVSLLTNIPQSAPLIDNRDFAGSGKVKDNDVLVVSGTASSDSWLLVATLEGLDAVDQPIPLPSCVLNVTSQLVLTEGAYAGQVNVGQICPEADRLALRAIVASDAGLRSIRDLSLSASLLVDNEPPEVLVAAADWPGLADPGYTAQLALDLLLAAEEPDASPVSVRLTGDIDDPAGVWLEVPATGRLPVVLAHAGGTGEFTKDVVVVFRDEVGNSAIPVHITLVFDNDSPGAPSLASIRLTETAPSNTDPAQVASSLNNFALSGNAGAISAANRVQVFADAALTELKATAPVDPAGSFSVADLDYNPAETYYLRAVDPAGNSGPAAIAASPSFVVDTWPAAPIRHGQQCALYVSVANGALAAPPTVTFAGRSGTCTYQAATTNYRCTISVNCSSGAEPDCAYEGANGVMVRVTGRLATLAPTSSGTDAFTVSYDFTPPSVNAASVAVMENPPPTADQLTAVAGAVSDAQTATAALVLRVFADDGTVTGCQGGTTVRSGNPNADGGFALTLNDNGLARLRLHVVDAAGNERCIDDLLNDVEAPSVGMPVHVAFANAGTPIDLLVTITDNTHDLTAVSLTVGGAAATPDAGNNLATGSGPQLLAFTYTVGALTEGPQPVVVDAWDSVGNHGTNTSAIGIDNTAPIVVNTAPGSRNPWNGRPAILGTAYDPDGGGPGSGVDAVRLRLRQTGGSYFNGSTFSSPTPVWLIPDGVTSWAYPFDVGTLVPFLGYTIEQEATDLAGNVSSLVTTSFTATAASPATPGGLSASPGPGKIVVSFNPVAGADAYYVYYDITGAPAPPYNGIGAAEGDSPVVTTATSLELHLPAGIYDVSVSTEDLGNESPPSAPVSAKAYTWRGAPNLVTGDCVALASPAPAVFVAACGASLYQSDDDGWTWTLRASAPATLHDLWAGGDRLVAVGDNGTVLAVDDAGEWAHTAVVGAHLKSVWGDGDHVAAVGDAGTAAYSADGGESWTSVATNTSNALTAISGWGTYAVAVGGSGTVLSSSTRGAAWTRYTSGSGYFTDVVSSATGAVTVAGDGSVAFVFNGSGPTTVTPTPAPSSVDRVAFSGTAFVFTGFAGGLSTAWRSTGGMTFASVYSAGAGGQVLGLWGGPTSFYGATGSGPTLWSEDDGVSFNLTTHPGISNLRSAGGSGTTRVVGGTAGRLYRGRPNEILTATSSPYSMNTFRGLWADADWLIVHASFGLLQSSDGGATFASPATIGSAETFAGNGDRALAAGTSSRIYLSVDRGQTWAAPSSPVAGKTFYASWLSSTVAYLVGQDGVILRSINGGSTWSEVVSGNTHRLFAMDATSAGTRAVAMGDNSTLVYTSNSGANFAARTTTGTDLIQSVRHDNNVWVGVGNNGRIVVATYASGWSFAEPSSGVTSLLRDVWSVAGTFFAVGDGGVMLSSNTPASSWTPVALPGITSNLRSIHGVGQTLVVVGEGGVILRSFDSGTTWIDDREGQRPQLRGSLGGVYVQPSGRVFAAGSSGIFISTP